MSLITTLLLTFSFGAIAYDRPQCDVLFPPVEPIHVNGNLQLDSSVKCYDSTDSNPDEDTCSASGFTEVTPVIPSDISCSGTFSPSDQNLTAGTVQCFTDWDYNANKITVSGTGTAVVYIKKSSGDITIKKKAQINKDGLPSQLLIVMDIGDGIFKIEEGNKSSKKAPVNAFFYIKSKSGDNVFEKYIALAGHLTVEESLQIKEDSTYTYYPSDELDPQGFCETNITPAEPIVLSCAANFPDGLTLHSSGTEINFEEGSQLFDNPDNVLAAVALINANLGNTCVDSNNIESECTASGGNLNGLNLSGFLTSTSITDVIVNGTTTVGNSGESTFQQIFVNSSSTLNFSSDYSEYRINQLVMQDDVTLNLSPGDYWIENFLTENKSGSKIKAENLTINIIGTGVVRLFINEFNNLDVNGDIYKDHLDFYDNSNINANGESENLQIISYGKMHVKAGVTIKGLLYANTDFDIGEGSVLTGAVSAAKIKLKKAKNSLAAAQVNYSCSDSTPSDPPVFSCDNTFTDGATSHNASGSINFVNNTYLYQGSDTVLASPTVNNNGWASSCWDGSAACSASGSATTEVNLSTFETTNNSATLTVENGTPQTIGNSSDNEYATITLNAGGELTTSNAQSTYKITHLVSNGGTLRLSPGEYWVENLSIATGTAIYLNEPGEVKFYVKNDVTIGSYSEFNKSAASDYKLIFAGYSNITVGVATRIDALVYAQGDIILQNNAHVVGAVSANNVSFETSSRVNYQCGSIVPAVDHYQIIHDDNGLTCATETVTIKACSNSYDGTCTESTVSTSLNLVATGASNTVTTATTFTGSTTVDFNYTLNETIALSVADESIGASNALVCNDNSSGSCNMLFASAGFIFTGIDNIEVAGVANTDVTIQAVKDVSGVCAGVFSNTQDVEFAIETISPSSMSGNKYTIGSNEINLNLSGNVSNYKTVSLSFGADSIAPLSDNTYFDAGNITLHAKHIIAATSENPAVTLLGNSTFYVRPYEFKITATNSDNQPLVETLATGAETQKAGVGFNLLIEAVNLQGNKTVNFTNKSVELSLQRTGPTNTDGGVDGTLTYSAGSISSTESANDYASGKLLSFTDGEYQDSSVTYSEVGLLNMALREQQTGSNAANHAQGSQSIGRFIPDHFTLTANMVENACDATNFTYMGQPALTLTYEIEAQNLAGNLTQNYVDSFIHSTVTFVAENATNGTNLGGRLTDYQGSWVGGTFSPTTGSLNEDVGNFSRNTVPDGPYEQLIFGLKMSDTDGSVLESLDMLSVAGTASAKKLSSTLSKLRFGRWIVENSSGPETSNLSQPMYAQYLASSGQYITNADDSCSSISSESNEVVLTDGSLNKDLTSVTQETSLLVNGYSHIIELTAPNVQGDVNLEYTVPNWLQFDWLNVDSNFDGPYDQNPTAIATFGVFRGNDRIISWREVGN